MPAQFLERCDTNHQPLATATGIRLIVIGRADVLDRERRKLLTVLVSNSDVEQAIVLATSEQALPSIVPEGVKFLDLDHVSKGARPLEATAA